MYIKCPAPAPRGGEEMGGEEKGEGGEEKPPPCTHVLWRGGGKGGYIKF